MDPMQEMRRYAKGDCSINMHTNIQLFFPFCPTLPYAVSAFSFFFFYLPVGNVTACWPVVVLGSALEMMVWTVQDPRVDRTSGIDSARPSRNSTKKRRPLSL